MKNHKLMWSLRDHPPTWDFLPACLSAKAHGAEEVVFGLAPTLHALKFPDAGVWNRVRNLLIPIAELCGMPWSMVRQSGVWDAPPHQPQHVDKAAMSLIGPIHKSEGYVTITLRNSVSQAWKNSDNREWGKVKEYVEGTGREVVPLFDFEGAPLSPSQRLAVYAKAEFNLGVVTGPMALCMFSTDIPYLMFHGDQSKRGQSGDHPYIKMGLYGKQLAFAKPNQRIFWEPDRADRIIKEYQSLTT